MELEILLLNKIDNIGKEVYENDKSASYHYHVRTT